MTTKATSKPGTATLPEYEIGWLSLLGTDLEFTTPAEGTKEDDAKPVYGLKLIHFEGINKKRSAFFICRIVSGKQLDENFLTKLEASYLASVEIPYDVDEEQMKSAIKSAARNAVWQRFVAIFDLLNSQSSSKLPELPINPREDRIEFLQKEEA